MRTDIDGETGSSTSDLSEIIGLGPGWDGAVDHARAWSIDAVLRERAISTVFQPVMHLRSATVAGFEALTRGPAGSALESPMALLAAAKAAGRLGELDWLCRTQAMHVAASAGLPDTLCWLINVEPASLAVECPAHLRPALDYARAELQVILEVVEREMQGNVLDLIRATDQARSDGWGVALDDVGAEQDSLALLPLLRPDVVKLDMSLVRELPHAAAATVTAAVRAYAESSGAVILAEGIETAEQEALALVFGATYGQGYYYGRPGPLPTIVDAPIRPIPLRQYVPPLDGRTPFEVLAERIEPQRAAKQQILHISEHLENETQRGAHASVLLAGFQSARTFTPAKQERFRHLAQGNALTIVLGRDIEPHDEPNYHVRRLAPTSRLGAEWITIVVSAHFAAAFVARECLDDPGAGVPGSSAARQGDRTFEFVYTYDRDAVIDAARRYLQELGGGVRPTHKEIALAAGGSPQRLTPEGWIVPSVPVVDLGPEHTDSAFESTARRVLDYLNARMPMGAWLISRVENERQTYLYVDDNEFGLPRGGSHPWEDTYCIHMVNGAPRIAPSVAEVPAYANAPCNAIAQIGAYAGAPIGDADGTLFGTICGVDGDERPDLTEFGDTLAMLSDLLVVALRADRTLQAARENARAAQTSARTDALTGIANRAAWDAAVSELGQDYPRYADPTVIVVIDLDDLKQVNDGPGGHVAGDQLIRCAARILKRTIRDDDFVARLGGDEFGIVFTHTAAAQAPILAQRLARALDRARVHASIGWSAVTPGGTVEQAVEEADRAMYLAKSQRKQALAARAHHDAVVTA